MPSIINIGKTPMTKKLRKLINKVSAFLTVNENAIHDNDWAVLRDWFFMMGNAANDRLPDNLRYKKNEAKIIDHRTKPEKDLKD